MHHFLYFLSGIPYTILLITGRLETDLSSIAVTKSGLPNTGLLQAEGNVFRLQNDTVLCNLKLKYYGNKKGKLNKIFTIFL